MQQVFTKPVTLNILQQALKNIPLGKTQSSLGADLPATEAALFTLEKYPLLDHHEGMTNLGSKSILIELLQLMINKELPVEKVKLQETHNKQDWKNIENLAHKLKSSALYCGTIRLKMACQYLERSQKADLIVHQEKLYQQLLQIIDETSVTIECWLDNNQD